MKPRLAPRIELLESRIAPAVIVNPTTVTYTDVDGDSVTVQITKGTLTAADFVFDSGFESAGVQKLLRINFAGDKDKSATDLTVTVAAGGGDGVAHIGYVDATAIDLGVVTLPGDLGRISAGDKVKSTPAIDQLIVGSVGVQPIAETQQAGGTLLSQIGGKVNSLTVTGDINIATIAADGSIAVIEVGGNIVGGSDLKSGSIRTEGDLGQVHIAGDIVGGSGDDSGQVFSRHDIDTVTIDGSIKGGTVAGSFRSGQVAAFDRIGQITVGGDIMGGAGDQSGQIAARDGITSAIVKGSLLGGDGSESGAIGSHGPIKSVEIGTAGGSNSIMGGTGNNSGEIVSSRGIQNVIIHGALVGGQGDTSGAIGSTKALGTVMIDGDLIGGAGPRSGEIVSDASISDVTVLGSVFGGQGDESGAIGSTGPIGSVKIGGNLLGALGIDSGWVVSAKKIGTVEIGGVLGTSGFTSGIVESEGRISAITVGGIGDFGLGAISIEGLPIGTNPGSILAGSLGTLDVSNSIVSTSQAQAQIIVQKSIGSITVGQNVSGDSQGFGRARISAGTSIDEISIVGSIFNSEILVGRGREGISGETREIPANPDARLGTVTVGRSWFDTSVAVGTFAGSDGVFGTLDDKISHGGNPTVVGTIERIEIGGSAGVSSGSFAGAGIVAEYIRSLSIGKSQIDLTAGPRNDLVNIDFKGGSFYAREKPFSGGGTAS